MEIKDLINEFNRMCDSITCEDCKFSHKDYDLCRLSVFDDTDTFIDLVTEWSKKNPKKTNREKFLEVFKKGCWLKHADAGYCNEVCISPNSPCADCPWCKAEYVDY